MTQRVPDLLPPEEAFATDDGDPAPVQILQAQGRLLGQRTRGAVRGEVEPVQGPANQTDALAPSATAQSAVSSPAVLTLRRAEAEAEARLGFWFTLYAPALKYRARLFLVEHGEEVYPLSISRSRGGQPIVAKDREQFYERVRELLAEERTTKLVREMRRLVEAAEGQG
jgi:hypothetical protein